MSREVERIAELVEELKAVERRRVEIANDLKKALAKMSPDSPDEDGEGVRMNFDEPTAVVSPHTDGRYGASGLTGRGLELYSFFIEHPRATFKEMAAAVYKDDAQSPRAIINIQTILSRLSKRRPPFVKKLGRGRWKPLPLMTDEGITS